MADLYSRFCRDRDLAAKTEEPSVKAMHLASAMDAASQIIGQLAMLGAMLDKIMISLSKSTDRIAEENPGIPKGDYGSVMESHMGLYRMSMLGYQDEAVFCASFEKKIREGMLHAAGIDPKDQEEALAYLRQRSLLAVTPTNPGN